MIVFSTIFLKINHTLMPFIPVMWKQMH